MEKIVSPSTIAILLATYNGAKYLKEQLDTLVSQSYQKWHLFVHDDGSTDETPTILRFYAQQYDNISILEYDSQKGPANNFLSLLQRVDAEYYMFCDQDDVWLNNKIETSILKMKELEAQAPSVPIVICSDLHIVDKELNITSQSYWEHAGIYPQFIKSFDECAASSVATGCTMLFNYAAKQATLLPAKHAAMHDSWVTLCTLKNKGVLHAIDQQLILYRQHGTNSLGATDTGVNNFTIFYRFTHFKQMFRQNKDHFLMLRSLGYGSVFKYIKYKIIYKSRIHKTMYHK